MGKIDELLEDNYGNPVGGKGSTHWYINDFVKQQILEAVLECLPKEDFKTREAIQKLFEK